MRIGSCRLGVIEEGTLINVSCAVGVHLATWRSIGSDRDFISYFCVCYADAFLETSQQPNFKKLMRKEVVSPMQRHRVQKKIKVKSRTDSGKATARRCAYEGCRALPWAAEHGASRVMIARSRKRTTDSTHNKNDGS